jgi:hypothetical protein
MTGKEYLAQAIELCKNCQTQAEALGQVGQKTTFTKTVEEQRSIIENMMERVFFRTPKGANSASIVLESAQKLQGLLADLSARSEEERQKRWPEAEECLQEFVERVEGMVQSAQGKTLAFT